MKPALKAIGVVIALIVVLIGVVTTVFVARSGMLTDRGPDQLTACTSIDGQGKSGEDILIDRERSLALRPVRAAEPGRQRAGQRSASG